MARFLRGKTGFTGNASSITISPPEHKSGDLLVAFVGQDATVTLSTTSTGWTKQAQTSSLSPSSGIFYNRASGSSEADLVVTSNGSGEFSAVMVVIEGTHATSVFNAVI